MITQCRFYGIIIVVVIKINYDDDDDDVCHSARASTGQKIFP
jgi:hypothetical protein